MKSKLFTALTLLCAMRPLAADPEVAIDYNDLCAMVKDGTNIAIRNSCNKYYTCQSANATLQKCSENYFFDKDNQQCAPQDTVDCYTEGGNPCINKEVGTFVGIPSAPAGYYYCAEDNVAQQGECPPSTIFDGVHQTCIWADSNANEENTMSNTDTTHLNICEFIPNGMYFGSSSSCQAWQICQNNVITSGMCPNGMEYNVAKNLCDYPSNVICTQVTNDPATFIAPIGGICSERGDRISDGVTCAGYFKCDGTRYKLKKCSQGMYFDIPTKKCVDRINARNDCDRCQGTHLMFVNTYSTENCKGYTLCKKGLGVSEGFCSVGFFDELAGACLNESDEPKYLACNPNANSPPPAPEQGTNNAGAEKPAVPAANNSGAGKPAESGAGKPDDPAPNNSGAGKPDVPAANNSGAAKPAESGANNSGAGKPDVPAANNSGAAKPAESGANNSGAGKPDAPATNNSGDKKPSESGANNSGAGKPDVPAANNSGAGKPDAPAANNSGAGKPDVPAANNSGAGKPAGSASSADEHHEK